MVIFPESWKIWSIVALSSVPMPMVPGSNMVNVCEMKFSQNEFVIDKDYDAVLLHKLARFGDNIS